MSSNTTALPLRPRHAPLLLFLYVLPSAIAQVCDFNTVTVTTFANLTTEDPTFTNAITLLGDATISTAAISLTTTSPTSYGAFFLNNPTSFQATGAFSLKFTLSTLATAAASGAWELIITTAANRSIAPPPYAPGAAANAVAGWSRLGALVVEFDSSNSGSSEQDDSASHLAVFLSGVRQCTTDLIVPPATTGEQTVWIDYDGFSTRLDIRIGTAGSDVRPTATTLSCVIDIWSTLDISTAHHIGFAAYNNGVTSGAAHALMGPITIIDAYRPLDTSDCAAYAKCAPRTTNTPLCLLDDFDLDGSCLLLQCNEGHVWDVSGSSCCAFVEKGAWVATDAAGPGPFVPGQFLQCEQKRRIVGYLTTSNNC